MDDPQRRGDTQDPFLSQLELPAVRESEDGSSMAMLWPIPSPRVRKVVEERLGEVSDHHFWTRVVAVGLASIFFLTSGGGLYALFFFGIGIRIDPVVFGLVYAVFFSALVCLAETLRIREPVELYRDSEFAHSAFVEAKKRRGLRGLPRLMLFLPGVVGQSMRKLFEASPATDVETLEAALRLLPALHQPLPLLAAESADLGGPDVVRRAVLLLHALGLAELANDEDGEFVICPSGGCAQLLRSEPFDADKIGEFEQTIRD